MAAILRSDIGSVQSVTTANAVANNAHTVAADKLTIDNGTNKALLVDFELQPTFASAPVAGAIELVAVEWSLDGTTAGPAPSSTMQGRVVGVFAPNPLASNALTTWRMAIPRVALNRKTDFYLRNRGTAVSLSAGTVLRAQAWSPE